MFSFLQPWFLLIGLIAIPALITIYLLQHQAKKKKISYLLLWDGITIKTSKGNNILLKLPPWMFWLELFILGLLLLTLCTPLLKLPTQQLPLTVILDDSFSLQANHNETLEKAKKILSKELNKLNPSEIKLIFARNSAIFDGTFHLQDLSKILKKWQAIYPESNLSKAISLAKQTKHYNERILVITDKLPQISQTTDPIKYIAVGTPYDNVAIIDSIRLNNFQQDKEIILVSLQNFSQKNIQQKISILDSAKSLIKQESIQLSANQIQTFKIEIPLTKGLIQVQIDDDALTYDNQQILLEKTPPQTFAFIDIKDLKLKRSLQKVLSVLNCSLTTDPQQADLYFTDNEITLLPYHCWQIHFPTKTSKNPQSFFSNAFILQKQHPILEGINFKNIIWSAQTNNLPFDGEILIQNKDTILLQEISLANYKKIIYFNLLISDSTIDQNTTWPILFFNLIQWRNHYNQGFFPKQIMCDHELNYTAKKTSQKLTLVNPLGEKQKLTTSPSSYQIKISPTIPGLYLMYENETISSCVVRFSHKEESNLQNMSSIEFNNWQKNHIYHIDFINLTTIFLLVALLFMIIQSILYTHLKQR